MKLLFSTTIFLCMLALTSCATNNSVGQHYKFFEPNLKVTSDNGFLKVYTFSYEEKGEYVDDPIYNVYKGYTVYTSKGKYVMDVKKSYNEPELVTLKEGKYIIIAELHKNIINSFAIEIEKGKILEVDENIVANPYIDLSSAD
jgi:hypothetical protein